MNLLLFRPKISIFEYSCTVTSRNSCSLASIKFDDSYNWKITYLRTFRPGILAQVDNMLRFRSLRWILVLLWCLMLASWCYMVLHGASRCSTMPNMVFYIVVLCFVHGASWCFMVLHGVTWCFMSTCKLSAPFLFSLIIVMFRGSTPCHWYGYNE